MFKSKLCPRGLRSLVVAYWKRIVAIAAMRSRVSFGRQPATMRSRTYYRSQNYQHSETGTRSRVM